MSSLNYDTAIRDFCEHFGFIVQEVTFEFDGKVPTAKINDESFGGLRNIVAKATGMSCYEFDENDAMIDSWIEFAGLKAACPNYGPTTLKEVNDFLSNKVYFIGNKLSNADILMFYILYNPVSSLNFQEKEKYIDICRWFNNIQQEIQQDLLKPFVYFSRTPLYG